MVHSAQGTQSVTLSIPCVRCGRPIELVADDEGVAVPDRDKFLAAHRACVHDLVAEAKAATPRQRRS